MLDHLIITVADFETSKGLGKNKSSHLASSFRRSSADPQSRNPRRSMATPVVSLNRIDQISPKSERDLGTIYSFQVPKTFYLAALRPLGYEPVLNAAKAVGLGVGGKPIFFIREAGALRPAVHVAFASPDRATVDRFYAAAIAAGGTDNGPPGLRTGYHPNYYGAFVLDPDGNNIEAVCHS